MSAFAISLFTMAFSLGSFTTPDYEILPKSVPQKLAIKKYELPPTYELIQHEKMLDEMGMKKNPDYIGNPAELETTAKHGGMASFLAIYGKKKEPRILLNGVYFRNEKYMQEFVLFQRDKKRPVTGFTLNCDHGLWLILVARDQDINYSDEEHHLLRKTLDKYKKRLKLVELFDDMW